MTTRSPLPVILGIAAVATILGGQFVTKGALYGESFSGIALGVIGMLKDIIKPTGSAGYLLALFGNLLIIVLMIAFFVGLLLGLGLAISIAARRSVSSSATLLASILFGAAALSTLAGLLLARSLPSHPDFHGEVHVEPYFFLWPALFAVLSIFYASLFRNPRNA